MTPGDVPKGFDYRHLHAETHPEERHRPLAGELHRADLALRPAFAERAGHQYAVDALETCRRRAVVALERFGLKPSPD